VGMVAQVFFLRSLPLKSLGGVVEFEV